MGNREIYGDLILSVLESNRGVNIVGVIENVIRSLIREGKINRARALLSVFEDEYPHLLMEVEAAAGNWKIVEKIYKTLPKDLQKEYEILFKTAQEKIREDYSSDLKEAVSEMEKNNLEGAMALLEGVTRKHPELIEAIALKYEIARKKGEVNKARKLEEILRNLDPSHPVLAVYASRSEKRRQIMSDAGNTMMFVSILIILVISIISLVLSPNLTHFNRLEKKIEGVEKSIESILPQIKPEKNNLTAEDIDKIVRNAVKDLKIQIPPVTTNLSTVLKGISKLDEEISKLTSDVNELRSDVNELKFKVDRIASVSTTIVIGTKASSPSEVNLPPELAQLQSWERIYRPSSELDRAKIYWLGGYIMYLKGMYMEAIRLFEKSLDIVKLKYPGVYFHDDCEYYRALSYYELGDFWQAKKLLEEFVNDYPKSPYRDDAEYFLKRIGGGA